MSWSSTPALSSVRGALWGFLMFAGVAWLAISWSVLRLEPTDVVRVAGPVILFGALSEALRALVGARTWWMHAGLAVLFAATGVLLSFDGDSSLATPSALIGWYLLVRGCADVVLATMARATDRTWGLAMVLGVVQTVLGFYAASSFSRTAGVVVVVLAALAVVRAIADLVTAMQLREAGVVATPREKATGVAGYAAGLADYAAAATVRTGRPRHRAPGVLAALSGAAASAAGDVSRRPAAATSGSAGPVEAEAATEAAEASTPDWDVATADQHVATADRHASTADLDAVLALAAVSGAAVANGLGRPVERSDADREPAMAGAVRPGGPPDELGASAATTRAGRPAGGVVADGPAEASEMGPDTAVTPEAAAEASPEAEGPAPAPAPATAETATRTGLFRRKGPRRQRSV